MSAKKFGCCHKTQDNDIHNYDISIMGLYMTLGSTMLCHYVKCFNYLSF